MNSNCSNLLDMRNLVEQVKKAFCNHKLFWPFTVWIHCPSDLKNVANSPPSALNYKSFSRSLEQFFLTVGQNSFGNKIPFVSLSWKADNPYCHTWLYCVFDWITCDRWNEVGKPSLVKRFFAEESAIFQLNKKRW